MLKSVQEDPQNKCTAIFATTRNLPSTEDRDVESPPPVSVQTPLFFMESSPWRVVARMQTHTQLFHHGLVPIVEKGGYIAVVGGTVGRWDQDFHILAKQVCLRLVAEHLSRANITLLQCTEEASTSGNMAWVTGQVLYHNRKKNERSRVGTQDRTFMMAFSSTSTNPFSDASRTLRS